MNPLLSAALGSIIRAGLQWLAAYLVVRGVWTEEDAKTYIAAAVIGLLALFWSLWQKRGQLLKTLSALILPAGATLEDASRMAKSPLAPSSTTPKDVVPVMTVPAPVEGPKL